MPPRPDRDREVAQALRRRYGLTSPWQLIAEQYANDIGLGGSTITVQKKPMPDEDAGGGMTRRTYGKYYPGLNKISLRDSNTETQNVSAMAHELSHAADATYGAQKDNASHKQHHAFFEDFEKDFPKLLQEQEFLELLNQQSMKLQHPWQGNPPIPSPWVQPKKF